MNFALQYKKELIEGYRAGKSTYALAKELHISATKVRKCLLFLGVQLRGYSEAQALNLKNGAPHPTKGKKTTEEVKQKIGDARAKAWAEMPEDEKQKFIEKKKKAWEELPTSKKDEFFHKAAKAVRKAATEGSRAEIFLRDGLENAGWTVEFHVKGLIPNHDLELDMLLPELKLVLEVDGVSHHDPSIWGEDKLQKRIKSDNEKSGLLLNSGYAILRVRQFDRTLSQFKLRQLLKIVLDEVQKVDEHFPQKNKRLIEIEVRNGQVTRI